MPRRSRARATPLPWGATRCHGALRGAPPGVWAGSERGCRRSLACPRRRRWRRGIDVATISFVQSPMNLAPGPGTLPAATVVLMVSVCVGSFVDSATLPAPAAVELGAGRVVVGDRGRAGEPHPAACTGAGPAMGRGPHLWPCRVDVRARAVRVVRRWDRLPGSAVGGAGRGGGDLSPCASSSFRRRSSHCSRGRRRWTSGSASSFAVEIESIAAIGPPPLAAVAATLGVDVAF